MESIYTITHLKCQSCTCKTHCAQCSAEAEEALLQFPGVDFAAVDLSQKRLRVSGPDEDTILDAIDNAGLLLG